MAPAPVICTASIGGFHVTAPTRRHAKVAFHLHFARLTDEDRAFCEGIPVTSVARTLLDLAAIASPTRLDRAIERAEERALFDLRAVDALLARAGGHRGAARLRRVLAIYRDDPAFTRSRLERCFRDLVRRSGLPTPSMNFQEGEYQLLSALRRCWSSVAAKSPEMWLRDAAAGDDPLRGLAGELCDPVEVGVVVQYGQAGALRAGCDQ